MVWVKINDEGSWALLDSGSTTNMVTLQFIKAHPLDVGSLNNLKINGFGGLFPSPLAMLSLGFK